MMYWIFKKFIRPMKDSPSKEKWLNAWCKAYEICRFFKTGNRRWLR